MESSESSDQQNTVSARNIESVEKPDLWNQSTQPLEPQTSTRTRTTKPLERQESTRNRHFSPEYEPFRENDTLQLNAHEINGPFWFMNPTQAVLTYLGSAGTHPIIGGSRSSKHARRETFGQGHPGSNILYKWTSRNNRKGRHALVVRQSSESHVDEPWPTTGLGLVFKGVWRMGTCFFIWDISYLVALIFTGACAFLVTNAVISFLPYVNPIFQPPNWIYYVEGLMTLTGCALFLISNFLGFIEAVNQNRRGCFGWRRERLSVRVPDDIATEHSAVTRIVPDWNCIHRRNGYGNFFQHRKQKDENETTARAVRNLDAVKDKEPWRWFPSGHELRKHFLHEIGFLACATMLCSSVIYCASAVCALVTIIRTGGEIRKWIRICQLVAGLGFTTASALFVVESQTDWWRPQLRTIGWQIGFWNLAGSAGFTISAACALSSTAYGAEFQLACSFFWGSWCFLISSVLQWYEALDKHPMYRDRTT